MKKIAFLALLVSLASGAFAHPRVKATIPEDGALIAEVPAEISFRFIRNTRLTRVEMIHSDQPSLQLDLGNQRSFDRTFTLPLQGMGAGTYRIEWRGLGIDGHAMQGEFTFTVE